MCLMLYMATREAVAPRKTGSISVEDIDADRAAVRQWFSLPHVRYVGAHTGCGCGFPSVISDEPVEYYDGFFDEKVDDERKKNLGSVRALLALIDEAPGDVELFPLAAGDEAEEPQGVVELRRQDLVAEKFFFTEHFLYRVTK